MNLRIQLAALCNYFRFIAVLTKVVSVGNTGFVNFINGQIVKIKDEQIVSKAFNSIKVIIEKKIFGLRNC
jgi:hypothetical protein